MRIFLSSVNMPELDFVMCHKCKYTKTKYHDKKIYRCLRCKSFTTPDDGFWKMRNPGEIISAGLELYYSGISLRETSEIFWRLFKIKISNVAILKWIRKYSQQVEQFKKMQRPKLSGQWSVDEKFIKVKGKKCYIWLVKDKKLGFVIKHV